MHRVTGVPPILRPLSPSDWPAVRAIYAEGIASANATFETEPPAWPDWDRAHLERHRLENAASLALHRRCGFRVVGVRERLGKLNGAWRDVLLLERRMP